MIRSGGDQRQRAGKDHEVVVRSAPPRLKARSCLIDDEAVICDEKGLAVFELLRGGLPGHARCAQPLAGPRRKLLTAAGGWQRR